MRNRRREETQKKKRVVKVPRGGRRRCTHQASRKGFLGFSS
ncbi:unnamed protein product [Spirodela intermedia]|uniref:Uncharacterized protein n=1 Tax=Spirodela intermedia TaxID=51605 RepID=A0A7I8IZQ4_SPIIN|nr:unnamed protein product [Spirodela intermedia]CAA6662641.1 unnamed protein product [Spirodela intermedia]